MKIAIAISRSWPLAAIVLSVACNKAPPESNPPESDGSVAASVDAPEGGTTCTNRYAVVGAVDDGVLSESIDGNQFTDQNPFVCTLKNRKQSVVFGFNDSSTDPSTSCKYALTYKNNDTGVSFSGSQTLSCNNASLGFTVTATPDTGDANCKGLPPLSEDPRMQLKTNNCGQDDDE